MVAVLAWQLADVLEERDATKTQKWLTLVDETRSRRKAIEAAGGLSYADFRAWVAAVEDCLAKDIVSIGPLRKAWKVGKYAHV